MPKALRARISSSGPSNAAALTLIDAWPDWPDRMVVLVGPEGSGKSHLAAIWAQAAGARSSPRARWTEAELPAALATGALVVEDLAAGAFDERALFHLLNLAREEGAFVLLTARTAPAGMDDRHPRSRLAAAGAAGRGAGAARRRAAARRAGEALRRPAARGRRER